MRFGKMIVTPNKLKTKFVLFTDENPRKIQQYVKLAGGAYNYFPIPPDFDKNIENGLLETRKLAAEAKNKGIPVETVIKQNLKDIPITFALIDAQDGRVLGTGCIKNHDYILNRARQAKNDSLVREILAAPTSWGCLEYVCVDENYRGHQLGKKIMKALCAEADKMGLINKGLFCAENEFGFYKKAGMDFGCFVEDGGVLRLSIGSLIDKDKRNEAFTKGLTFGQVMDFLDTYEMRMDTKRNSMIANLGDFPSKKEILTVYAEYPEVTYPARAPTGLMLLRKPGLKQVSLRLA
jgi:GNAT superfamily N-acetyltransferase